MSQRVTDAELAKMNKKEFCWPIPDLVLDMLDVRKENLGLRLELFDARARIAELERLSASQEEAHELRDGGAKL